MADYFGLSARQREARTESRQSVRRWDNKVQWARQHLILEGYLQSGGKGIWRMTRAGERELKKHGLLDVPFIEQGIQSTKNGVLSTDAVNQAVKSVKAEQLKQFPQDFLTGIAGPADFLEIEVPPVMLQRDAMMSSTVTAPGLTFRYGAKSPAEASYILYAHRAGARSVALPRNTLLMFKAVKAYEAYTRLNLEKSRSVLGTGTWETCLVQSSQSTRRDHRFLKYGREQRLAEGGDCMAYPIKLARRSLARRRARLRRRLPPRQPGAQQRHPQARRRRLLLQKADV